MSARLEGRRGELGMLPERNQRAIKNAREELERRGKIRSERRIRNRLAVTWPSREPSLTANEIYLRDAFDYAFAKIFAGSATPADEDLVRANALRLGFEKVVFPEEGTLGIFDLAKKPPIKE